MYCPNCGTKNVEDAKFCDNCGQPLGAAAKQEQTPQQEAPVQQVYQQPYQEPQTYQQPAYGQQPTAPPSNGVAIASLTLGIVAAVFIFIPGLAWVSIICAIIGLILGISAKKKAPSGMATAGLVLSIIALAISVVVFIACLACAGALASLGASFS